MDLKLQQAIAAARAGSPETAQIYLTELIQEKPNEPDAWFLLSYLVDGSERQARYLQQVLALDADYELAREHLARLEAPGVPAPVIRNGKAQSSSGSNSGHATVPPATGASRASSRSAAEAIAAEQLPEWLQDLQNKRLGAPARSAELEWATSAGAPKREKPQTQQAPSVPAPAVPVLSVPAPVPEPQADNSQKMLLGILLALIIMSLLVLVFLVSQIF